MCANFSLDKADDFMDECYGNIQLHSLVAYAIPVLRGFVFRHL
jgi:hypothetical protein